MSRSEEDILDEILSWDGFEARRLARLLADYEARLERLERAHPKLMHEDPRKGGNDDPGSR